MRHARNVQGARTQDRRQQRRFPPAGRVVWARSHLATHHCASDAQPTRMLQSQAMNLEIVYATLGTQPMKGNASHVLRGNLRLLLGVHPAHHAQEQNLGLLLAVSKRWIASAIKVSQGQTAANVWAVILANTKTCRVTTAAPCPRLRSWNAVYFAGHFLTVPIGGRMVPTTQGK